MIHSQRLGIVNKAEVDVFLELSCILNDPMDFGYLISAFSKSSLNIWKFTVHILLKPDLENLENSAGLEKVIFHSNPKERQCPQNAQTTTQLHTSHMLAK